jgi:SAM-dependent methyltransferase
VLGVTHTKLRDHPDGALGDVCRTRLAADVVAAADSSQPDGLLVFDTAGVTGHLDHVAATAAGLLAAEMLNLPVLGWTIPEAVAAQLNQEFGASFSGHAEEDIDLRVSVDRDRQRLASRAHVSQALPGSGLWRRLELLANTESLRWLRPSGAGGCVPLAAEKIGIQESSTTRRAHWPSNRPDRRRTTTMDPVATRHQQPVDVEAVAGQQNHWAATFDANPDMYGTDPSAPGLAAAEVFAAAGLSSVLELGAGQGRDTLYMARQGLHVTALDYAPGSVETISEKAQAAGLAEMVSVARHDIRQPLPLPDVSIDASYSHMLFSMALTTSELERLAAELRRVLRPGGLAVYTARTTADPHYGTGTPRGDDMFEHGGYIVHFFDRALIHRLATGFELIDVTDFTEGDLPRRIARVTMRVPQR